MAEAAAAAAAAGAPRTPKAPGKDTVAAYVAILRIAEQKAAARTAFVGAIVADLVATRARAITLERALATETRAARAEARATCTAAAMAGATVYGIGADGIGVAGMQQVYATPHMAIAAYVADGMTRGKPSPRVHAFAAIYASMRRLPLEVVAPHLNIDVVLHVSGLAASPVVEWGNDDPFERERAADAARASIAAQFVAGTAADDGGGGDDDGDIREEEFVDAPSPASASAPS